MSPSPRVATTPPCFEHHRSTLPTPCTLAVPVDPRGLVSPCSLPEHSKTSHLLKLGRLTEPSRNGEAASARPRCMNRSCLVDARRCLEFDLCSPISGRLAPTLLIAVEQIQRKIRVRGSTPENAPRIRAGMEKKEQKPELKKNQTRRCYAEKTSIFFQTTDRHPPGARRETTEVKTRKC